MATNSHPLAHPQPAGRLQPDAAERLGLPAGIVVGPGGGDNAMAALGVGAVEEGTLVLSLGTSGARGLCMAFHMPCIAWRAIDFSQSLC